MCPLDAPTRFLSCFGSSGCVFRLLAGKLDFLQPFLDLLTCSKFSVGLLESSATLCMRVHAFVGLSSLFGPSMHGTVLCLV